MTVEHLPMPAAPPGPPPGRPTVRGDWPCLAAGGAFCVLAACPPGLLAQLTIDAGFGSTLRPSQVRAALLNIAGPAGGTVTVAYTRGKVLAAYLTIYPVTPIRWEAMVIHTRWERHPLVWEFGSIEVSRSFRGLGLARHLLEATFATDRWEEVILVSQELAWHWDLTAKGLTKREYRAMLHHILSRAGFVEYRTDEGNIAEDPANIFMARVGARVAAADRRRFEALLVTGEPF